MKIVVTGGAGFIGSALCRHLVREVGAQVVNLVPAGSPRRRLIALPDRPGHDHRYAINAAKRELGWRAEHNFDSGLAKTVRWYLENRGWWGPLREGVYAGERLGLIRAAR